MSGKLETLIKAVDRRRLADGLIVTLAASFTLAVKTQGYGWNVTGPFSGTLRPMFNEMQVDLYAAVDEIAVRIRVLGSPTPSAFSQYAVLSGLQEEGECPDWREMVRQLVDDQDVVAKACQRVYGTAEFSSDTATLDLMARRIPRHERNAWELRVLLD